MRGLGETVQVLFVGLAVAFVAALCIAGSLYVERWKRTPLTTKRDGGLYSHKVFGTMYCAEEHETACGITLAKCWDEATYRCLHDVRVAREER